MTTTNQQHIRQMIDRSIFEVFGIDQYPDMKCRKHETHLFPRYIAQYFYRKQLGLSLKKTGEALGSKDHATVLNATRRILNEIELHEKRPSYNSPLYEHYKRVLTSFNLKMFVHRITTDLELLRQEFYFTESDDRIQEIVEEVKRKTKYLNLELITDVRVLDFVTQVINK